MSNIGETGEASLIANAQTMPTMKVTASAIVAAEMWQESANGSALELANRMVIAGSPVEETMSRSGGFGKDVAEQAWRNEELVAKSSTDACTLDSALPANHVLLAYPCSCVGTFHGVLVLCLHYGEDARGAAEIWGRDDREELGLEFSHYANLQYISRISQYVKFPRAAGLPGQTWDNRSPILMEKLDRQINFMRATAAKSDGLSTGLSVPLMKSEFDLKEVMVLLSSTVSPVARAFEIWSMEPGNDQLLWESAAYGPYIGLEKATWDLKLSPGDDLAGQVLVTGVPGFFHEIPSLSSKRSKLFQQYGLRQAISWPVYVGPKIGAVVNLFF